MRTNGTSGTQLKQGAVGIGGLAVVVVVGGKVSQLKQGAVGIVINVVVGVVGVVICDVVVVVGVPGVVFGGGC